MILNLQPDDSLYEAGVAREVNRCEARYIFVKNVVILIDGMCSLPFFCILSIFFQSAELLFPCAI